jgi:hypothetical protein
MRRQLFAAGVAVALMISAGAPALATPGHGKAKGHVNKPAKTKPAPKGPKAKQARLNGGGVTTEDGASFSVQVRADRPRKGHFNYTTADGALKVRCHGVDLHPVFTFEPAPPTATITATCREITAGKARPAIDVSVKFTDNGATDSAEFTFTRSGQTPITDNGVKSGNVKIRNK